VSQREPILNPGGGVTLFVWAASIAFALWFPGFIRPTVDWALTPVLAQLGLPPLPSAHSSEH
jgi:hypothetical protein